MLKNGLFIFAFEIFFLSFAVLDTKAQSFLKDNEIPKDLVITLERTTCFGNCAAYKLIIDNTGKVVFEGYNFTETKGKAEKIVTQEQLKRMIVYFEKVRFFELNDKYQDEKDGCTWLVTDHPSEIISIQINGKTKEINHYFGCGAGNPTKMLGELGIKIDEIVETKRWIGEQK